MERLKGIELLTQVYWSEHSDSVDVILAMHRLIVKAVCSTDTRECRITLYRCLDGYSSVREKDRTGGVVETIFSMAALAHGIAWCVDDPETTDIRCPHCNARYSYSQEKFIGGTSVECQNCAKVFDVRQTPVELPPTRALGEPTECPYCRAKYVYTEEDLDEERTAGCRNCGVRIAFPSILDQW